jgi:hypothetical protein
VSTREYMREYMRKYRAEHPEADAVWRSNQREHDKEYHRKKRKRIKKLKYMREYHKANYERLHPASVVRWREHRERRKRQALAAERFLDAFDRFERIKLFEAARAEAGASHGRS